MKIAALEVALGKLADQQNHNAEIFQDTLAWAEVRIHVQERITNDVLAGTVRTKTVDGALRVDMVSYLEEYAICMAFADFAESLAALAESDRRIVPAVEMPDIIVFGGSS